MKVPRFHAIVATLLGKIYVFGGVRQTLNNRWHYLNTAEWFDTKSNTWKTMNPMLHELEIGSSVITFGGTRCYVLGANLNSYNIHPSFSCFDARTNSWEILPSPKLYVKWPFPSTTAWRGAVLGYSIVSTGSHGARWFPQEENAGDAG